MAISDEPQWRKSSRSGANANCVEVSFVDDAVLLRHSKNPRGLWLRFTREEWAAFLDGVRDGEFTPD